jgi:hypothetical protein
MREEMIRNDKKWIQNDTNAKSLPAMSFRTLDRFRMFQIRVLPASLSGTLSLYSKNTHAFRSIHQFLVCAKTNVDCTVDLLNGMVEGKLTESSYILWEQLEQRNNHGFRSIPLILGTF